MKAGIDRDLRTVHRGLCGHAHRAAGSATDLGAFQTFVADVKSEGFVTRAVAVLGVLFIALFLIARHIDGVVRHRYAQADITSSSR